MERNGMEEGVKSKSRQDEKIIDLIKKCEIKEFNIEIYRIPKFVLPYCKIINIGNREQRTEKVLKLIIMNYFVINLMN